MTGPGRRSRRRAGSAMLSATLVVLSLAACGQEGRQATGPRATPTTTPTPAPIGLQAGEATLLRQRAKALFSYDYRHLDSARKAGLAATAGGARAEYQRTFDTVRAVAPQYHAVVRATGRDVGILRRLPGDRAFLIFVDQVSTTTRSQGAKATQSSVVLDVDDSDRVTKITALGGDSAEEDGSPLQAQVRSAILPLLTLSADSAKADADKVLQHATGKFYREFSQHRDELVNATLENRTKASVKGQPAVALVSQSGGVLTALVFDARLLTSRSDPKGNTVNERWRLELVTVDGQLKIQTLSPVS